MSILDGLSVAALQARLAAMQAAYLDLSSGAKVATASYSQGEGSHTISYRQVDMGSLAQAITTVQRQIDRLSGDTFTNRRAPLTPYWRG